jgi:hypothetical protein
LAKPKLEIADIFREHGPAWRQANAGHVNLSQLKVMSSIEACRTEALGGHVAACTKCNHQHIAYNSCKNRHCPKCQGPAARDWMAARAEDLLPVEYFHVVFTLPAEIARIAYWNKKAVYGLLFKTSAQTVMTIAADPKRLGARVGMTCVLHTWGSALTHHPHVHMIVPGGGLSKDGNHWAACKPGFFLHVRVLSRLFRRLFIEGYRIKDGDRRSVMRLSTSEFIRRFLIHVLPDRFHRIRHYGLLASSGRKANIAKVRILLGAQHPKQDDPPAADITPLTLREPCPDCGGVMRIIETFRRGQKPQSRAPPRKAAA